MQKLYQKLAAQRVWLPDNSFVRNRISQPLQSLVIDKGSLTTALINLSDDNFSVSVLDQRIALPNANEQIKLERPLYKAAMIRQVELRVHDVPVVFARSVIPLKLVCDGRQALSKLGRQPLGQLLFRDGRIRVSKREFCRVNIEGNEIIARRTPYDYQGSRVLVAEYFLPSIAKYL